MPTAPKTHSQRKRERDGRGDADRAYDRGRRRSDPALRAAKQLRDSVQWQNFRAWFKRRHPLCADPFGHHVEDGVTVAVDHVHHVIPAGERPDLAFVEDNCASLCVLCHGKIEGMERSGKRTAELFAKETPTCM